MPGTRKLGRPTAHRNAMLRGMVTYLLENGQIETTLTRAKEVRSMTEKMITLGKKNTLASDVQLWHTSPRKMLSRSSLIRLLPNTLTETAATPVSIRWVRAVVTAQKWQSSSSLQTKRLSTKLPKPRRQKKLLNNRFPNGYQNAPMKIGAFFSI